MPQDDRRSLESGLSQEAFKAKLREQWADYTRFSPASREVGQTSEDEMASLVSDAIKQLDDPTIRVEATPNGPFSYEDPLLASAWDIAQEADNLNFLPAAEGEDLNSRVHHWIPVIIPVVLGRLARNWDVLGNRAPNRDIQLTLPLRLAIFGDGGYRGLAQRRVFEMIERCHGEKPFQLIIHLGDTYHGGSESEMLRHLAAPLSDMRVKLEVSAYSLCGNHDLYAGPDGYLATLSIFGQPGRYFAIETPGWRIACLDSALGEKGLFRLDGLLDKQQVAWLREKQTTDPKRLIVLTHHCPRSAWGGFSAQMLSQLIAIPQLKGWYWGHEHRSAAYSASNAAPFWGGCVGHGAFLERWEEAKSNRDAGLTWYPESGRCTCYSTGGRRYWPHGFLELEVRDKDVRETWHTEGVAPFDRTIT
jgi:3',5'-cyclic AMP phosphodiesterase CpdA